MAASLVTMVARGSSDWDDGPGIASQARALRSRLTALGEEDATAFAQVLVTMRDPTGTPEQRDFALGLALLRAAEVPLRIAEAAADVAELAAAAAGEGSPHLQPDATAAAALAEAATQAATHLVEINLAIVPGDRHSERAASLAVRRGCGEGARAGSAMSDRMIPAWSLTAEAAGSIGIPAEWPDRVTRDWAIGGATGEGVDVCILDSGVDGDHPLVGGVESAVAVTLDGEDDHDRARLGRRRLRARHRLRGHRPLARAGLPDPQRPGARRGQHRQRRPDSRRSPPRDRAALRGRQPQPLDDEAQVRGAPPRARRLRLLQRHGARRLGAQHAGRELSVALLVGDLGGLHESDDSLEWYANPNPPVEFFARGVDLDVAWFGGSTLRATGNSFAAPHIAGLSALVLSKHPGLTPFQLKSVLYLTATNAGGSR